MCKSIFQSFFIKDRIKHMLGDPAANATLFPNLVNTV